jgi:hypothetical protein
MQPTTAWMGPPSDPGRVMTTRGVWEGGADEPVSAGASAERAASPARTYLRRLTRLRLRRLQSDAPAAATERPRLRPSGLRCLLRGGERPQHCRPPRGPRAGREAHRPGSSSPPTCWPPRRTANSSTAAKRTASRPAPRSWRRRTSARWRSWRPRGCMALRCGGRSARSRRRGRM